MAVLSCAIIVSHVAAFIVQPMSLAVNRRARTDLRACRSTALVCSASDPAGTIRACALLRSADGADVVAAMEAIEAQGTQIGNIPTEKVAGSFDLVFSSTLAKVPLINGYMPTKEVITWDIEGAKMKLDIETLPFLPKVLVEGNNLTWNEAASKVAYTIKNKEDKPPSEWTFFFADDEVLAGRSSVTGLNVLKRFCEPLRLGAQHACQGIDELAELPRIKARPRILPAHKSALPLGMAPMLRIPHVNQQKYSCCQRKWTQTLLSLACCSSVNSRKELSKSPSCATRSLRTRQHTRPLGADPSSNDADRARKRTSTPRIGMGPPRYCRCECPSTGAVAGSLRRCACSFKSSSGSTTRQKCQREMADQIICA
eukprot:2159774-Rhodomonas_salina.2